MIHALLKGRADGGSVEDKVLSAHRAEHKAMAKGRAAGGKAAHGDDCACPRCTSRKAKGGLLSAFGRMSKADGGRTAHAKGGRSGKGTKINIISAPGGANPPDPTAGGLPPSAASRSITGIWYMRSPRLWSAQDGRGNRVQANRVRRRDPTRRRPARRARARAAGHRRR